MKKLVLALALLVSVSQASAQVKAVFNMPKFSGQINLNIENELIANIDKAVAGSTIHFAIYDFDRPTMAVALLKAQARGVKIHGVFDGSMRKENKRAGSGVNILVTTGVQGLAPLTEANVKFCRSFIIGGSCRAMAINHNKFMIFSQLSDGRQGVVALTSANWNSGQFKNQNDLLVFSNDLKLYNGVLGYWNGLMNSSLSVPLFIQGDTAGIYTFPNKQSDPVVDLLNMVSCNLPGSKIRVMQSRFLDDRIAIAERLAKLSQQGCDVKVLDRDEPDHKSPGAKVSSLLGSLQTVLRYKGDGENDGMPSIHSKIVAIDASINGSASKMAIVLAGSHNLNGNSLHKNDELLARVINRDIVNQYFNYFDETVSAARAVNFVK